MSNSSKTEALAVANRATTATWDAVRARPRTVLATFALGAVTAGIAMNWTALVAAGIAPLLISALPCAVMCALGLCMAGRGRRSCETETGRQRSDEAGAERARADPASNADHSAQLQIPFDGQLMGDDELQPQQERRPTHA